jgi:hypothetical protein
MIDTPINIASVNMRKRNAVMHALLHSSPTDHIILIQEPWFDKIGTARKDTARDGVDVLGGVASPGWEAHYPATPEGSRAKVMAYSRKRSWEHTNSPSIFTTTTRQDLCAHPCVMVLDLTFDDRTWRIVNFYNDVNDRSALDTLLSLDLDPIIPTLVVGDFNTHSRSWSPQGLTPSPQAGRLEEWAVGNLLVLANEPGVITRRGAGQDRDSTIDLTWYNDAAIEDATFGDWTLDWAGSLGSDHALTRVQGSLLRTAMQPDPNTEDLGFVIDEDKADEWSRHFKAMLGPLPPLPNQPTADEVEELAQRVHNALQGATAATMKPRQPYHPSGAPWWNADCAQVTGNLRSAETQEDRKRQTALLRAAARKAKRKWADGVIGKSNLWEVATWRHGRRMNKVPPLRAGERLAHEHADISHILSERFFVAAPPPVPLRMDDDPPLRDTRDLPPYTKEMLAELLANASNRSAPGASGQTWRILKWAWNAASDTIFNLVSGCVRAGHHLLIWRLAIVCAVPKPNRADYSLAKNFRPISLLECMGKLVEKLVARLLYREIITHDLVPTNQFGGRMASSTLDAGLTLLHDIQIAHAAGLRTGLLLFDIQGFFDNVNRNRLVQIMADLGFSQELVGWTRSFLAERTVRLKFNGHTSNPFHSDVGTPQGSPISPVLSVIYTQAILRKAAIERRASLSMYIDDGAIFACGNTWEEVESSLTNVYTACTSWLERSGLVAEPDKTELMFFRRPREREDPPGHIFLPIPAQNTYYKVSATHRLRYLGFFFDHKLRWEHHVNIMCNRTRATTKALQLLGNSVRGLNFAQWRMAFNAICLPVLTYGCQLWFTGKQKTLVKKLQVAQNEAVKIISGAFRTTPREPLHQLLNIFPIDLRLRMLTDNSATRLYRLQKSSQVLTRLGKEWHPQPVQLPTPTRSKAQTALRALASRVNPNGPRIEAFPNTPLGAPRWGGRVTVFPIATRDEREAQAARLLQLRMAGTTPLIFLNAAYTNKGRHDDKSLGASAAVLYYAGKEWGHAEHILGNQVTKTDAEVSALRPALALLSDFLLSFQYAGPVQLVTGSAEATTLFLKLKPSTTQHLSIEFSHYLDNLLSIYPGVTLTIEHAKRDPTLVGFKRARHLLLEAIKRPGNNNYNLISIDFQRAESKAAALQAWEKRFYDTHHTSQAYDSTLTSPPDGRPHTILRIASTGIRVKGTKYVHHIPRDIQSTLFRLITGHAFTGAYRLKFKRSNLPPATEEEVACACGAVPEDTEHVLLHCPLTHHHRRHHLFADGPIDSLRKVFDHPMRCLGLLRFLEASRACVKPRAAWEPG